MMYSFTGTPRDALHSITQRCTGGQDIAAEFLFNEKGGWRLKNSDSRKSISLKDIFNGKFFSWDGRFMELINGFGELVMLSVAFLICCIPVVTIGPAMTSLYYAVIKSVRRGRGTPLGEFFSSMKRTLGKGIIVTLEIMAVGAALYIGYRQAVAMNAAAAAGISDHDGKVFATVYVILGVLFAAISVYIFPVLSRFTMKTVNMWKLAFVMGLRFLPVTIAVITGTALLIWLQIYVFPIPCVAFVPGCWCFIVTFMMEKVLLHYMPEPGEGEEAWYYNS